MRIEMLQTRRGCPDGSLVQVYEKGKEYDVVPGGMIGPHFLRNGWAELTRQEVE